MEEKFQQSVRKLKDQIDKLDDNKANVKSEMTQLLRDLEHHLDHPDDSEHAKRLNNKVLELIAKFELEHPKLAETLGEITMILSNMGI